MLRNVATFSFAHLHLLSSAAFSSLIFFPLLFSSLTLPTSAFSSVHVVGSLTSKLPSAIIFFDNWNLLRVLLANGFGDCGADEGSGHWFLGIQPGQQETQAGVQWQGQNGTVDLTGDSEGEQGHPHISDAIGAQGRGLQDLEFLLHMSPGAGSIIPVLLQLQKSQEWHQGNEEVPLRHVLATTMMKTLEHRLATLFAAEPTTELYKERMENHLITNGAERTMPFLRWDQTKQCLVPNHTPGLPA